MNNVEIQQVMRVKRGNTRFSLKKKVKHKPTNNK